MYLLDATNMKVFLIKKLTLLHVSDCTWNYSNSMKCRNIVTLCDVLLLDLFYTFRRN